MPNKEETSEATRYAQEHNWSQVDVYTWRKVWHPSKTVLAKATPNGAVLTFREGGRFPGASEFPTLLEALRHADDESLERQYLD